MGTIKEALEKRFGIENTQMIESDQFKMPLMLIELENKSKILTTVGLSEFRMPVPERYEERSYNELFFYLPNYWDIENFQNTKANWVFEWIEKLSKHVVEKQTWFGPGHTIPCGNPFKSLSETMKQNHLLLIDPLELKDKMQPILVGEELVYFLGIVPIYEDEMDYKQGKGTFKLLQKLVNHGITEKLDDYRGSILKSKWRFFVKK